MRMLEMIVSPANCQVVFYVPDAEEDPPEWSTGRELVVANSGAIYVSTWCDMEGDVYVEVWMGQELPGEHRQPIYDGTLQVRDAGALVGSFTGNHLGHLLGLREGMHRVRVFTDSLDRYATRVYFVID